ncbi:MAG TPA: SIR2 family protein [Candidatus Elarobacter sp.]|jgi:hypothetical protein
MIAQPALNALVDALAKGQAAVFVGAGLSAGAGLATWNQLTRRLADELEIDPEHYSPLEVAQLYVDRRSAADLSRALVVELRNLQVQPTRAHEVLASGLGLSKVYTTNFDDLFEFGCRACGRRPAVIIDAATFASAPPDDFWIIKLHGDLNAPGSIVLAATDFERYLDERPEMVNALAHDFLTRTVLFVGYGFGDPDIQKILRRVQHGAGKFARKHYIAAFDPAPAERERLEGFGLTVIEVPSRGDVAQASIEWLAELERLVAHKRSAEQVADEQPAALPRRSVDLIGRDAYCADVFAALDARSAVLIRGLAGMGKTSAALAVTRNWLHRDAPRSRVAWFSARERSGETHWLNEILDAVAVQVNRGDIATHGPEEVVWKRDELTRVLAAANAPVLIVLDNFETVPDEQLDELADWVATVPPPSAVLVTSRPRAAGAEGRLGLHVMELNGLNEPDALALLDRYARRFDKSDTLAAGRPRFPDVVKYALGNPEAMKLAVSVVQDGALTFPQMLGALERAQAANDDATRLDAVYEALLSSAWEALSPSARSLMTCVALFVSTPVPRGVLIRTARLDRHAADDAVEQATHLALLEETLDGTGFLVHPKVREFAARQLRADSDFERRARRECAEEYCKLVKGVIHRGRQAPHVRYWRSLVSAEMRELDPHWPMIREQLEWAKRKDVDLLRELVVHLVHYMDSRCLNAERIAYTTAVVDAYGDDDCPDDLALLRIDALAWTYLEEGKPAEAEFQVARGEEIAEHVEETYEELLAVAKAWRAVARTRLGFASQGSELIAQALAAADALPPWIRMRIQMAAGDLALASGRAEEAYRRYENAAAEARAYNDGLGYQLHPRLGLALVMLPGHLPETLNEAQRNFDAIRGRGVPSGKIYGDYGLGLVEFARERIDKGRALIRTARAELARRRASSLLRALMDDLYLRLDPDGIDGAASSDGGIRAGGFADGGRGAMPLLPVDRVSREPAVRRAPVVPTPTVIGPNAPDVLRVAYGTRPRRRKLRRAANAAEPQRPPKKPPDA